MILILILFALISFVYSLEEGACALYHGKCGECVAKTDCGYCAAAKKCVTKTTETCPTATSAPSTNAPITKQTLKTLDDRYTIGPAPGGTQFRQERKRAIPCSSSKCCLIAEDIPFDTKPSVTGIVELACSARTSCSSCMSGSNCGWCATSAKCFAKDESAQCKINTVGTINTAVTRGPVATFKTVAPSPTTKFTAVLTPQPVTRGTTFRTIDDTFETFKTFQTLPPGKTIKNPEFAPASPEFKPQQKKRAASSTLCVSSAADCCPATTTAPTTTADTSSSTTTVPTQPVEPTEKTLNPVPTPFGDNQGSDPNAIATGLGNVNADSAQEDGDNTGLIVGVVIAVVGCLALAGVLGFVVYKSQNKDDSNSYNTAALPPGERPAAPLPNVAGHTPQYAGSSNVFNTNVGQYNTASDASTANIGQYGPAVY